MNLPSYGCEWLGVSSTIMSGIMLLTEFLKVSLKTNNPNWKLWYNWNIVDNGDKHIYKKCNLIQWIPLTFMLILIVYFFIEHVAKFCRWYFSAFNSVDFSHKIEFSVKGFSHTNKISVRIMAGLLDLLATDLLSVYCQLLLLLR